MGKILSTTIIILLITGYGRQEKTASWEFTKSADGSKPIERHEAGFARVNDKFYLLGGRGVKPVSIYNVNTKEWSTGEAPPFTIHHFQPVVYDNKIYIIGALTGDYPDETPVEHVYIYDPLKDSWIKGDPVPKSRLRGSMGAVLYKDKIYLTCGIKNGHIGDHKNWFDCYNPAKGNWKTMPDVPRARDHFQAVVLKDKLYLAAGRLSKAPEETMEHTIGETDVYNFETGQWSTIEPLIPTQRAGNAAIGIQNSLVIIGGESVNQIAAHSETEVLNVDTREWSAWPSLNQGRHGTGIIIHEGTLYIASGCGNRGGSPELQSMEKMNIQTWLK